MLTLNFTYLIWKQKHVDFHTWMLLLDFELDLRLITSCCYFKSFESSERISSHLCLPLSSFFCLDSLPKNSERNKQNYIYIFPFPFCLYVFTFYSLTFPYFSFSLFNYLHFLHTTDSWIANFHNWHFQFELFFFSLFLFLSLSLSLFQHQLCLCLCMNEWTER